MRINIYGRFILEIVRKNGQWLAFHVGEGTRRKVRDLAIPGSLKESELIDFLDDFYHEYARPDSKITILSKP